MSEDDADQIVRRIKRKWRPFRHIQGDEDLADEALNDYRKALAPFDPDVLERAWELVVARHRFPCWPYESEFLDAARQAQRELHPLGQDDKMAARVTARSDEYVRRFMKTSVVAARAREGNYEAALKQYVRAASLVQAQLIEKAPHLGYQSFVLFGRKPDQEAVDEFFQQAREQAETGSIRVTVPRAFLKQWAEEASKGRGR